MITAYSLNDFNSILFNNEYKLDKSILQIISDLNNKLGVYGSFERPIQKDDKPIRNRNRKNAVFANEGRTEEAWETLRTFKATVVEKKTVGIEKTLNDIRICLNKISQKNYDAIEGLLLESIELIFNTENSEESMKKIAHHIFDIASSNKFFSEIYARIYKVLVSKYTIFQTILSDFVSLFITKLNDIKYVDQNTNYDEFCANNKINDSRKATSVFIVNLVKIEVLPKTDLLVLINSILDIILEYIEIPDKLNQVEEITENIYLFVCDSYLFMKDMDEWNNVFEKIQSISQMKVKEKSSLSNRTVFKYMDIMDKIKKL
jgi:hypothetical protein